MGGIKARRHKQSRHHQTEQLISTRREDGLWQSIERDDEDLAFHSGNHATASVDKRPVVAKEEDVSGQHMVQQAHQQQRDTAIPDAPLVSDVNPVKKDDPTENQSSISSRADVIAWVSISPPQRQIHPPPPPSRQDPEIPRAEPTAQHQPQAETRRRRGRPKKSRNAPNWNRPRRVRFSDPIPPPGPNTQPESRDTHVFVRLLKIIVTINNTHPPQRQEVAWNNRAKGWRLAGERSERSIADIGELFDDLPRSGSLLKAILAPTVQRGAREPVEMGWDASRCCFQGLSQDVGSIAVALGEMRDMVKDPWARQFVGYVLT